MTLIERAGGRKFIATIGCGFATTLLTWYAKIDAGTYSLVIISTVGGFITGNVWQKKRAGDPE